MINIKSAPLFSVVIAVYNEGNGLYPLIERIDSSLELYKGKYEVILVDDRSQDNSWSILNELANKYPYLKLIRFCRNFGQHSAISAGLKFARGEYVVLMDCDLQDEPEYIIPMYEQLITDDKMIVYARRMNRQHQKIKIVFSFLFHKIVSWLSGVKTDPRIGTYRIMKKIVVDSFNLLPEHRRYVGGLFYWMGFDHSTYDVNHKSRVHGESNYSMNKMLALAKLAILSFSTKLLSMGIYIGLISSIFAVGLAVYYLIMKLIYHDVVAGFTATIVSIYFIGGIILIVLGVIGEYLGELFKEIKGRPNFIIEETKNIDNN